PEYAWHEASNRSEQCAVIRGRLDDERLRIRHFPIKPCCKLVAVVAPCRRRRRRVEVMSEEPLRVDGLGDLNNRAGRAELNSEGEGRGPVAGVSRIEKVIRQRHAAEVKNQPHAWRRANATNASASWADRGIGNIHP